MRVGGIVIEPFSRDLKKRVSGWTKMVLNMRAEPFSEEIEETWKWVGEDYAERKLGLLP